MSTKQTTDPAAAEDAPNTEDLASRTELTAGSLGTYVRAWLSRVRSGEAASCRWSAA